MRGILRGVGEKLFSNGSFLLETSKLGISLQGSGTSFPKGSLKPFEEKYQRKHFSFFSLTFFTKLKYIL